MGNYLGFRVANVKASAVAGDDLIVGVGEGAVDRVVDRGLTQGGAPRAALEGGQDADRVLGRVRRLE